VIDGQQPPAKGGKPVVANGPSADSPRVVNDDTIGRECAKTTSVCRRRVSARCLLRRVFCRH
jgi:hypothetical protein